MKSRVLALVLIFAVASSIFAGCQVKDYPEEIQYLKVVDSFDQEGWKPFVSIEVKEKKLKKVSFDAVNIDAKSSMLDAVTFELAAIYKVDPAFVQQLKLCAQALIEKQDVALITFDANGVPTNIPGVTASVKNYFDMAQSAIDAGRFDGSSFGNDDGATSEEATSYDKDGWKRVAYLYVKQYVAIAVNFDAINKKGESRKTLNRPADKSWIEQNKRVEDAFMKEQSKNPTLVFSNFVKLAADGTTAAIPGVTMSIKDIVDLVALLNSPPVKASPSVMPSAPAGTASAIPT